MLYICHAYPTTAPRSSPALSSALSARRRARAALERALLTPAPRGHERDARKPTAKVSRRLAGQAQVMNPPALGGRLPGALHWRAARAVASDGVGPRELDLFAYLRHLIIRQADARRRLLLRNCARHTAGAQSSRGRAQEFRPQLGRMRSAAAPAPYPALSRGAARTDDRRRRPPPGRRRRPGVPMMYGVHAYTPESSVEMPRSLFRRTRLCHEGVEADA